MKFPIQKPKFPFVMVGVLSAFVGFFFHEVVVGRASDTRIVLYMLFFGIDLVSLTELFVSYRHAVRQWQDTVDFHESYDED